MNMKRQRGRNNGRNKPHMPVRAQTFDSSGPEVRIRGNAYQVLEKYLALARDATAAGDRIAAENFYQHAEHYFRMINANSDGHHRPPMGGQPQQQGGHPQQHPQMQPPHNNSQPHGMATHDAQSAVAEPGSGPQPLTAPYPSTPSGDGQR
jgi:Domain of unknown function (DUF4167)